MKVPQPVNSNYSTGLFPESGGTGEWHENLNRFLFVCTLGPVGELRLLRNLQGVCF